MLNRVKGATPFERRDGLRRLGSLISVERRQTRRSILNWAQPQRRRRETKLASIRNAQRQGGRSATEKKAFCARQKISFHHTLKTRRRQPRAGGNNATFLAKILAFSTKPFVSVVFSPHTALNRRDRDAPTRQNYRNATLTTP